MAKDPSLVRLLCCASVIIFCGVDCSVQSQYDDLCDKIVEYSGLAAQSHNKGNFRQAEKYVSLAKKSFLSAVKLDDSDPQAYLNYAQFLLNANKPAESLQYWANARLKIQASNLAAEPGPDGEATLLSWIDSKIALSKYAHYSIERDRSYAGGQGNISQALAWAVLQLSVYQSPQTHFDIATLEVILRSTRRLPYPPRSPSAASSSSHTTE
mmetsp:Transcript_43656/g.116700  ORF Transcript_43656/g.116700 Transcript_43656/m.116700 type:complete len:211 (+) Transcript_43656:67-699(+)